jgi:hypothetical protein
MRFNPDEYIGVHERIEKFYVQFPEGRINTAIVDHVAETGFILMRAEVYRGPDDAMPAATGHTCETKGGNGANQTSHVENAETSAVGRALMLLGFEVKRQNGQQQQRPEPRRAPSPSPSQETAPDTSATPAPRSEKKRFTTPELHGRIGVWRKKLREERFETAASLNKMLGEFGCTKVEELTREDALKHGKQLNELYQRHVAATVDRSANQQARS